MISWPASAAAATAKNKSPWFTLAVVDPLLLLICWSYQLPSWWRRNRASSWIALITQLAAFIPSVFLGSSQLSLSFSSSAAAAAATTEQRGQLVRLYYVIAKYRNSGCFLPIETISFLPSTEILAQKKKTAVKRDRRNININHSLIFSVELRLVSEAFLPFSRLKSNKISFFFWTLSFDGFVEEEEEEVTRASLDICSKYIFLV